MIYDADGEYETRREAGIISLRDRGYFYNPFARFAREQREFLKEWSLETIPLLPVDSSTLPSRKSFERGGAGGGRG